MTNSIHSIRVIDGDTVEAMVAGTDFFKNDFKLLSIRIYGIDTPEKNTVAGKLVKQFVIQKLGSYKQPVVMYYAEDKFSGRGVGDIVDDDATNAYKEKLQVSLSKSLLAYGLARPYNGGKKSLWTDKELMEVERKCSLLLPEYRAEEVVFGYKDNAEQYNEEEERSSLVYYGTGYLNCTMPYPVTLKPPSI
jgi:endonuclease YncB( thermonuclease family)